MTLKTIQEVLKRIEAEIPAPTPRYCPRCENEVTPTNARWNLFDCAVCETVLFESEVDCWPGQTKGKVKS
jgi:hypothetical protein